MSGFAMFSNVFLSESQSVLLLTATGSLAYPSINLKQQMKIDISLILHHYLRPGIQNEDVRRIQQFLADLVTSSNFIEFEFS
jgi:hypothetical protein